MKHDEKIEGEDQEEMVQEKEEGEGEGLVTKRRKLSSFSNEVVRNKICHCCRVQKPKLVRCPLALMAHLWCTTCLEHYCHLALDELTDSAAESWPQGCPICTGFCPCEDCRQKRGTSRTKKDKIKRSKGVKTPSSWQGLKRNKTLETIEPHSKVKATISSPLYFDFNTFTLELFVKHVIQERTPVILQNATSKLDPKIWSREHLRSQHSDVDIVVRYQGIDAYNLSTFRVLKDQKKKVGWYLANAEEPNFAEDPDFEWEGASNQSATKEDVVIYAKDFCFGDRVTEWKQSFLEMLPPYLAPAGPHDIIGAIPEESRPVVLMAYMGAHGSRTPIHIDKLNSIAFNVHIWGEGVKSWWMVNHNDTQKLRAYLRAQGRALHADDTWVNPHHLRGLDIRLWEFHQKKGEMVLVPPGVPHEVYNQGGISFAAAANIVNEASIPLSWESEKLNRTLRVNSVYKFKAAVYHGILRELATLESGNREIDGERLEKFIPVFMDIINEEELQEDTLKFMKDQDTIPHRRICDNCKVDIFNRRVHCPECGTDPEEGFDICIQCYKQRNFKSHHHRLILVELYSLETLRDVLKRCLFVFPSPNLVKGG